MHLLEYIKLELAVAQFRKSTISAGSAALMAGKSLPEMLTFLSNLGIALTTTDTKEADHDMKVANEWLQQHP